MGRASSMTDLLEVLRLIATPMRPDGTWNRDREACRILAAEALYKHKESSTMTERAQRAAEYLQSQGWTLDGELHCGRCGGSSPGAWCCDCGARMPPRKGYIKTIEEAIAFALNEEMGREYRNEGDVR